MIRTTLEPTGNGWVGTVWQGKSGRMEGSGVQGADEHKNAVKRTLEILAENARELERRTQ